MKRIVKILILAGVLLFLGLMIMMVGIGFILGDSNHHRNMADNIPDAEKTVKYETKTFTAEAEDIQKLVLDLTEEDVQIMPAEGEEITVEYVDLTDDPQYVVKSENGVLKIGRKSTEITGNIILMPPVLTKDNFKFDKENGQRYQYGDIVVCIPESYTGDYDMSYTSGSVDVEDIHVTGGMEFDLTSGAVRIDNVTGAQDLSVDLTSGEVQVRNASFDGNLYVNSTSGDISLTATKIGGDLDVDATSGNCYADQLTVKGSIGADLTSGDIYMEDLTLETAIEVSGTSGNVHVSLTDGMKEYTVRTDTVSGSCNLPTDYSGGAKRISVSTTSGDIDFQFMIQE